MTRKNARKVTKTLKLYTTGEIADMLGISQPSVSDWTRRGYTPEPYAVAGNSGYLLFTKEQVDEMIEAYRKRLTRRVRRGERKDVPQHIKHFEPVVEVEPAPEGMIWCDKPNCGMPIVNQAAHDQFTHSGSRNIELRSGGKNTSG